MSEQSALLGYTPEEIALKKAQARILYKFLSTVHKLKVIINAKYGWPFIYKYKKQSTFVK